MASSCDVLPSVQVGPVQDLSGVALNATSVTAFWTHSLRRYFRVSYWVKCINPWDGRTQVCGAALLVGAHYSDLIMRANGVSNHRRLDYLLNCLFRRRSKKTSMLRVSGLCEGNSPVTGEFPVQRASNAENVSI